MSVSAALDATSMDTVGDALIHDEESGLGGALSFETFVKEAERLHQLCEIIEQHWNHRLEDELNQSANEFIQIVDRYQEQSTLLDPHMEVLVSALMQPVRTSLPHLEWRLATPVLRAVYYLCKVRGQETVSRFFPHDVADLMNVLVSLEDFIDRVAPWETRYVHLLWLSVLALIPFDFRKLDAHPENVETTVLFRLQRVVKLHMGEAGKTREAASLLMSRILSRPDTSDILIPAFIEELNVFFDSEQQDPFRMSGYLGTLWLLYAAGSAPSLSSYVDRCISYILRAASAESGGGPLQRKLAIKVAQYMALSCLRVRVAPWRYQVVQANLLQNLGGNVPEGSLVRDPESDSHQVLSENEGHHRDCDDEEFEMPQVIESIVGCLLEGLRDSDTVVRWSAAKGVGRVCMRLPRDLVDDVVASLSSTFSPDENENAWHGACLAIAELSRRGLLLPSRLSEVVRGVEQAVVYDQRKGSHSVGSHVRDAACYVFWAFCRAYSPSVLLPYVKSIASSLLTSAVYDREVSCRRAAAAAFQECVGRQGDAFPHGIDIITTADYFTLSNIHVAYLDVAPFVASFPAYRRALIEHLIEKKLNHWDRPVRELASRSLHRLIRFALCRPNEIDDDKASDEIDGSALARHILFERLLPRCFDADLCTRHGAILASGETLVAIVSELGMNGLVDSDATEGQESLDAKLLALLTLVPEVDRLRLYRGRGGELIRDAVNRYLECIALANIPIPHISEYARAHGPKKDKMRTLLKFMVTLDENIGHPNEEISFSACRAYSALLQRAVESDRNLRSSQGVNGASQTEIDDELIGSTVGKYVDALRSVSSTNPTLRRGYALALGSTPLEILCSLRNEILDALLHSIEIEDDSEVQDAESRRNAVVGLWFCSLRLLVGDSCVPPAHPTLSRSTIPLTNSFENSVLASTQYARGHADNFSSLAKIDAPYLSEEDLVKIFQGLITALDDYSIDKRGDVGSWIRERACEAVADIIKLLLSSEELRRLLPFEQLNSSVVRIARLTLEKLDRTRAVAIRALRELVDVNAPIPCLQSIHSALSTTSSRLHAMDFSSSFDTFRLLVPLFLDSNEYAEEALLGLVTSIGGISEHVMRDSTAALAMFLRESSDENVSSCRLIHVCNMLSKLLDRFTSISAMIADVTADSTNEGPELKSSATHECLSLSAALARYAQGQDPDQRIVVPLLRTIDAMMSSGAFEKLRGSADGECTVLALLQKIQSAVSGSKEASKLLCAVGPFSYAVSLGGEVQTLSLQQLLSFCFNRFPKVRSECAKQLYTVLLTYEEEICQGRSIDEGDFEQVLLILSETPWDQRSKEKVALIKEERNKLYPLLRVPALERAPKSSSSQSASSSVNLSVSAKSDGYKGMM